LKTEIDYSLPLTDEQAAMVEANHSLIYDFLHRNHLNVDDYYGLAALGLIRAVQAWYQSEYVRTFKFSTIANQAMNTVIGHYWRTERRHAPAAAYSLDEVTEVGTPLGHFIPDERRQAEVDQLIDRLEVESLLAELSDDQKTMLRMAADDIPQRMIGQALGMSQVQVCRYLAKIRKRLGGKRVENL